jgi:hypothetical protein
MTAEASVLLGRITRQSTPEYLGVDRCERVARGGLVVRCAREIIKEFIQSVCQSVADFAHRKVAIAVVASVQSMHYAKTAFESQQIASQTDVKKPRSHRGASLREPSGPTVERPE